MSKLVVAITGASGSIYAVRFLRAAAKQFDEILLTASEQAFQVLRTEMDISTTRENLAETLVPGGTLRLAPSATRAWL